MAETVVAAPERAVSDYSRLLAQVRHARLLDRSVVGYFPRMLVLGVMAGVGLTGLILLGHSWWQLAVAAYFGIVFAQIGFLGHDAGHQQICQSRRWNDRIGMVLSNVCVGLSYGWWVEKHTRHHRNPNQVGSDPDVGRNVLAWTDKQADDQRGVLRVLARHQAMIFFPLLLLEAWNLHVGSVRRLIATPKGRLREGLLLLAHVAIGMTVLLLLVSPLQALAFVAVQQSLFGLYLGCSFAPNHKGMPIVDENDDLDFLRRQVLTSRNVTGGGAMTAALGGLNYQIEHHLFPSMPSQNLRRCRPIVKAFCATNDVSYCETSLFGSYARTLRYLGTIQPGKTRLAAKLITAPARAAAR
jgi:fatty acid desaturase